MTKDEIIALIDAKIAGQGTNVDAGSALPAILKGILDIAVGGENVQSDWNEADNTKPDYIKNKPTIPAAQVQADIYEDDETSPSFIKGIFHENRSPVEGKIELSQEEFYEAQGSPFLVFSGVCYPPLNISPLLETYIRTGYPGAAIVAIFGSYYEDDGSIESASLYSIAEIDAKYYLLASEA